MADTVWRPRSNEPRKKRMIENVKPPVESASKWTWRFVVFWLLFAALVFPCWFCWHSGRMFFMFFIYARFACSLHWMYPEKNFEIEPMNILSPRMLWHYSLRTRQMSRTQFFSYRRLWIPILKTLTTEGKLTRYGMGVQFIILRRATAI